MVQEDCAPMGLLVLTTAVQMLRKSKGAASSIRCAWQQGCLNIFLSKQLVSYNTQPESKRAMQSTLIQTRVYFSQVILWKNTGKCINDIALGYDCQACSFFGLLHLGCSPSPFGVTAATRERQRESRKCLQPLPLSCSSFFIPFVIPLLLLSFIPFPF